MVHEARHRDQHPAPGDMPEHGEAGNRWLTVPNMLCSLRLVGAAGLFALALWNEPLWLLALFAVLAVTDWLDGKLAVWLDQRSTFGRGSTALPMRRCMRAYCLAACGSRATCCSRSGLG